MSHIEPAPAESASHPRRWPLFLAGIALFLIGPAMYVVQFQLKSLFAPWYAPILATLGAALMVASAWRRGGIARSIGAAFFVIVCGLEWFMLGVGTLTPLYTGPAEIGRKIPVFTTTLADGTPFTEKDLERGNPTVLLFFRGRW